MGEKRERSARKGGQRRTGEPEAWGSPSGRPPHVVWAVVSAVVLVVFAPGLFVAGFVTNDLVNDDGGGTSMVAQPSPSVGTPSAQATGTPPPVVPASADDDPFIGPADAPVTIIEFSDYQ